MFLLTFRKIRKRDKSDIGVSSSSLNANTQTTNFNSNFISSKTNITANTQQPIKLNKSKNNSNETLSFNTSNLPLVNKNTKNSASNLELSESFNTTNTNLTNKIKSSTLPFDKTNSYTLNSNHTTDLGSYGSIVNTLTSNTTNTNHHQTNIRNQESVLTLEDLSVSDQLKLHSDMTTSNNKQSANSIQAHSSSSLNNSTSYLDEQNLKLAVVDYADILKLIKLQNSIEYQEWLAFNTKMYFDQINVLYGAIVDHCTPQTCPTMNAPLNTQFYWLDDKGKKFKYSASQYIDTALTHAAKLISDETCFPTKCGHAFPVNFDSLVKKIHKYLFNILAHMYHSHYRELLQLKLHTYVNSIYLHFYTFNKTFNILDEKEIEVMDALNKNFLAKYSTTSTQQLASSLMHTQQQPTIHASSSNNASSSSSGFSFFKKKLNFNLMA